jgi:hypothetical protein
MMPQRQSIAYWEAETFPFKWKYHSTAHTRILNDATMVNYQGKWWLFALHEPNKNKDDWFLHILFSNSPLGPWHDTPFNCGLNSSALNGISCIGGPNITTPHRRGRNGVRPGGHMFIQNNRLYRMVQNSLHYYGDSMDLYEITTLSTTQLLNDTLVPEFRQSFRSLRNVESWSLFRYHHIDLHQLQFPHGKKQWVGLFDGDYNDGRQVTARNLSRCSDYLSSLKI